MQENPYQAPQSEFTDNLPPAKKPIAVWIFQILATLFVAKYLLAIIALATIRSPSITEDGMTLAVTIMWQTAFYLALVFGIVGTQKKKLYGRIIGAIFIGYSIVIGVFTQMYKAIVVSPITVNNARFVGEITAYVVILGLFGWWLYAFSFSEKARRYFRKDKNTLLKVKA